MLDSVFIAMTGLHGYEKGLRVISNNTANMNTPGFKKSSLQFTDLFYSTSQTGGGGAGSSMSQYGFGLGTLGTAVNFQGGQLQTTGKDLDIAVDGDGMFVLRDSSGNTRYTRDGEFKFDPDGNLISTKTGEQVMGIDPSGALIAINIAGLGGNVAKATGRVNFSGNLSSTTTVQNIGGVTVLDASGSSHTLSVSLTPVAGKAGSWNANISEGGVTVGTGRIAFISGQPDLANATISLDYAPAGQASMRVVLDFSRGVTSFDSGSQSTLAFANQDGYGPGVLTRASFDTSGTMVMNYSNGQIAKGARLALARFDSPDAVEAIGTSEFKAANGTALATGAAGVQGFGVVRAGMIEMSNVDLSEEFSTLVIMQRGYQASSQIISTANEMLNDLFQMRGK